MKTKIAFIVNELNFFLSHRLNLAEEAMAKNYEVTIIYGNRGRLDSLKTKEKKFRYIQFPLSKGRLNVLMELKSFFSLIMILRRTKPHLVHLITIKPYLYGGIAARLNNVPAVVTAVTGLGTLFVNKSTIWLLVLKIIYPFMRFAFNHKNQLVIFQNSDDSEEFIQQKFLKQNKVRLIKGSGVDISRFQNIKYPKGDVVITYVGRLIKDKGVNEFIDAARLLKLKGVEARFLLVGDIDPKNPSSLTEEDITQLEKDQIVEFKGYVNNIPYFLSTCSIVCLPSYREGFPKVLIEAAAAGRAIITTDVAGCRDAIIPNKTGILVPPRDAKELADAMMSLIENPKKIISMGLAGRRWVEDNHSLNKITKQHFEIYSELLN